MNTLINHFTSMSRLEAATYIRNEWPFPHRFNPGYEQVKLITDKWATEFGHPELREFVRWNVPLLIAHTHPDCNAAKLERIALFYYGISGTDEVLENLCAQQKFAEADGLVEKIFEGEDPLWAYVWARAKDMREVTKQRFLDVYFKTLTSIVELRKLYTSGLLTIDLYYTHREHDLTVHPPVALCEYELDLDVSDDEYNTALVQQIRAHAITACWLQNDIISLENDLAANNKANLANLLYKDAPIPIPEAKEDMLALFFKEREIVLELMQKVETGAFSENIRIMSRYAVLWVAGYFEWSKLTPRYYQK